MHMRSCRSGAQTAIFASLSNLSSLRLRLSLPRWGKALRCCCRQPHSHGVEPPFLTLCIYENIGACDSKPPGPILDYALVAAIAWPLQRAALPAACPCQSSGNATRLSTYQLDVHPVSSHLLIAAFNAFCISFFLHPAPLDLITPSPQS